ncbi:unnamed protein product, partial [Ectocarpus sp. 8 AP-2014]
GLSDARLVDPLPASFLTRCCREFMTGKKISPSPSYQTSRTRIQLRGETRSWFIIFHHGEQQPALAHFRPIPLFLNLRVARYATRCLGHTTQGCRQNRRYRS